MPRRLAPGRSRPLRRFNFSIPEENVLDLRQIKLEAERGQKITPKRQPAFSRAKFHFRNIHLLRFSRPRLSWLHVPIPHPEINPRLRPAFRSGSAFLTAGLISLLPIFAVAGVHSLSRAKGQVLASASQALDHLAVAKARAASFDFTAASREFQEADLAFNQASASLSSVSGFLRAVLSAVPGSALASGTHLLNAGKSLSEAGVMASELLGPTASPAAVGGTNEHPRVSVQFDLVKMRQGLSGIEDKLVSAQHELSRVSLGIVPQAQRDAVRKAQGQLSSLVESFPTVNRVADLGVDLFGYGQEREYLLAFENNAELRPGGGFLGSLALVAVKNGEFRVVEVPGRGPYELDTPNTAPLIPPVPIQYVNGSWKIQDANWWPDFPTSAAKVMWFYEQSRGFPVDGVIALTPDVITGLLGLTGSVDMQAQYGITVTADSFVNQAQREVELNYDKAANKPKQFIADLMPLLLQKAMALSPERWPDLLALFDTSLQSKQLLVSLRDQASQATLTDLGWSGRVREAPQDYLQVVTATIAGGKTDRVIQNVATDFVDVQSDGSMVATVSLTRKHNGRPGEPFTGERNLSYVRLYAPQGSQLLAVQGFSRVDPGLLRPLEPGAVVDADLQRIEGSPTMSEATGTRITTEFGKTVFGNWLEVQPGEERSITFRYRLPFTWFTGQGTYQLLWQKEPGAVETPVKVILTPPPATDLLWSAPPGRQDGESVIFSSTLDQDREFSAILKTPKQ